ncbi:retrovirus-related pol polyprotein from transposon TNT 1-94 [Tanacetum coccineum]|uniref:Retrovirus-related pol polyprotein from transposon TNT 1-94 n=1 Tax=Tanacetum coccineum TaxID=301880 RepID=A0ABQ5FFT1_9ASTR
MTEFPQLESCLAVPIFTQRDDPIACLNKAMAFLSAVASSRFPSTNNQLRTSSNPRNQATIQDGGQARVVKCYNCQGEGHMARQCTQPKWPRNAAWFKDKAMLAEAQESGQILDEEQLAFLADPGIQDDVISEEKANQEKNNESLTAELERYKERVKMFKPRLNIDLSTREKMIDSQMADMIKEKLALKQQIDSLKQNLSNQIKENEYLLQTFTVFKNESKEKESKYMDKEIDLENKIKELDNIVYKVGQSAQIVHMLTKPYVFYDDTHKQALGYQNLFYLKKALQIKTTLYDGSVISNQHLVIPVIDDEETLILEEVSRSKLLAKQNDPISKEKKISTTLINYVELNQLSEDFGKRFVPQQGFSAEQAFWLQTSHPNTDQSDISPVKIEAPRVLPKISLKKLKYHLGKFDTMVKKQITPDAIIEGEWGDYVNLEMQSSESCDKCSDLDAELLKKQNAYNELSKTQLQAKDTTIRKLKERIKSIRENYKEEKVKQDMDEIETINIKLEHSLAKLLSENELLHKEIEHLKKIYKYQFDSIKKTRALSKEHCDSLIAQLNSKSMENADLKGQIQEKELLVYVQDTCPNTNKPSENLVAVTPMNKVKKVRFSEPLTSSSNINKQVESSKILDSNTPVLPCTGLKSSTSAIRSQPTFNKKNVRIS